MVLQAPALFHGKFLITLPNSIDFGRNFNVGQEQTNNFGFLNFFSCLGQDGWQCLPYLAWCITTWTQYQMKNCYQNSQQERWCFAVLSQKCFEPLECQRLSYLIQPLHFIFLNEPGDFDSGGVQKTMINTMELEVLHLVEIISEHLLSPSHGCKAGQTN